MRTRDKVVGGGRSRERLDVRDCWWCCCVHWMLGHVKVGEGGVW